MITVKQFKKQEVFKSAKKVRYFDLNGKDISNKPSFILDLLPVIGTACNKDGTIDVDVEYID